MVKYLAKFLPDLSEMSEPWRCLTHKDVKWTWTKEQTDTFQCIKQCVTSTLVLRYFDPAFEVEGQGDASDKGFGFV